MRWFKRGVVGLVTVLVAAIAGGAAWQGWSSAQDARRFPMPGTLVDIAGRRLHLHCTGLGSPLVLLENGLTLNYTSWMLVQEGIAGFTRVCSYDRAGLGWSDVSASPMLAHDVAADLDALRSKAGLDGPVILVGWSAGGVYARRYIAEHPEGVVGLVLVESSHEQQGDRMPRLPNQAVVDTMEDRRLSGCRRLAWTGAIRALHAMDGLAARFDVPAAMRPAFLAMSNRTDYCAGVQRELRGIVADVRSATPPASLGSLPLIVLTRGKATEASAFSTPVDPAYPGSVDSAWRQLQGELTALSSRAKQIVVPESDHFIPWRRPEAVVEAVRELVEHM